MAAPNVNAYLSSAQAGVSTAVSMFRSTKSPIAVFFHLIFKLSAILVYILFGWFSSSFVLTFVLCVILLAFDFWTVKNITGRKLAGLRWWVNTAEDGSNKWVFECVHDPSEIDPTDKRIFWAGLVIGPVVWVTLLLLAIFKFNLQWMLIVAVALALNIANFYGYWLSSSAANRKWSGGLEAGTAQAAPVDASSAYTSAVGKAMAGALVQQGTSAISGFFGGGGAAASAAAPSGTSQEADL